jgi:mRNA-degrading endonuclease RelE of RelBE toxin-antitoxin system
MSKASETAVKMIESLPEPAQEKVVEALRALVEDARDEANWDKLVGKKKSGLTAAARKARKEIAAGKARDMDYDDL